MNGKSSTICVCDGGSHRVNVFIGRGKERFCFSFIFFNLFLRVCRCAEVNTVSVLVVVAILIPVFFYSFGYRAKDANTS